MTIKTVICCSLQSASVGREVTKISLKNWQKLHINIEYLRLTNASFEINAYKLLVDVSLHGQFFIINFFSKWSLESINRIALNLFWEFRHGKLMSWDDLTLQLTPPSWDCGICQLTPLNVCLYRLATASYTTWHHCTTDYVSIPSRDYNHHSTSFQWHKEGQKWQLLCCAGLRRVLNSSVKLLV